jgi:hypothetical protein
MMQEPASETGGLLSVVPRGPWVIIFGQCGRNSHGFGLPDGCDELGDQVREYHSKQNARRVPMPSQDPA